MVADRGKRQFLNWKYSVRETLTQMNIKRTYVHYVSLQTQRGGLSSLLCIFPAEESQTRPHGHSAELFKELGGVGDTAAHQQNQMRAPGREWEGMK